MDLDRRRFGQLAGALAVGALVGAGRPVSAAAAADDPLRLVAPELRPAVRAMLARPQLVFSDATLPQIQANAVQAMAAPAAFLPIVPVTAEKVAVRIGRDDVLVYVINARPGTSRPAIVYMHGGGFVGGTAKGQVSRFQALAAELDCAIVSVEYHLAPDARYDTAIEETYAALKWLYRNADQLGVDRRRIAVMGESAGGTHAATLAFTARDRGEVPVMFQLLVYPALDDRTASTHKLPPHLGAIGWGPESHRFAWRCYLGMAPGGPGSPIAAIPARRNDLAGLPPAWIGVGSIDLLAPEALDYARRLTEAGVPTELDLVPGAFHGFDKAPNDIPLVDRFNQAKTVALRRAFDQAAG